MSHLWPTGSSWEWPPSITARYFSACLSDSTSRRTPCHLGRPCGPNPTVGPSPWLCPPFPTSCPFRVLHGRVPQPTRHYPRLWIRRPSSERRRDLNPPDQDAAQHTLRDAPTPRRPSRRASLPSLGDTIASSSFRPRQLGTRAADPPGVWGPGLQPAVNDGSDRVSQVPEQPSCPCALFLDPGRTESAKPLRRLGAAPACVNNGGSRKQRFRGSIARHRDWLSTLRSGGHPPPRKTRFRLLARLCRAGFVHPQGCSERFPSSSLFLLSRAYLTL